MKKVLFATTALIATAGIASADVAISGYAEMGVFGGDGIETQFHTDIDVTFTLSGETDGGITFGAAIDIDESAGAANGAFGNDADDGGIAVFISGDFGTLTMGDTDGAFDWALTEVNAGSPGSLGDNETGHAGYNGNSGYDGDFDGQILRYDYSFGDFAAAVSVELDDTGAQDPIYAVGARYNYSFSGGSVALGLGYQSGDHNLFGNDAAIGVSASVSMDMGLTATVNYSVADLTLGGATETHVGVGVSYAFDAITVHANYGQYEEEGSGLVDSGFGLAASYDFGGGMTAHVGYGSSDVEGALGGAAGTSNGWSLGLAMSF